jgi:hypothetical protein
MSCQLKYQIYSTYSVKSLFSVHIMYILGYQLYTTLTLFAFRLQEPGSLLGFKEFGINFERIKEGLDRTRVNAELKDDIQKESEKLGRKK